MSLKINEKAVLAHLSIGLPGQTRQDKHLTEEIKLQKALGKDGGRWVKDLYPARALAPLSQHAGQTRKLHNSITLLWPDDGWGVLPSAIYFDYTQQLADRRAQFERLREDHFLANYDEWVTWSKAAHNGAWDASQYPGVDAIRKQFKFSVEFRPVPESCQFSNTIGELLGDDKGNLDQAVDVALKQAHADLWDRLKQPLEALLGHIKNPPEKIDGRWKNWVSTQQGNLLEIANLIPKLNIAQDAKLEELAREVSQLYMPEPTQLLEPTSKTKADELFNRVSAFVQAIK